MTLDNLSNEDQLEIEYAINENIAEQTSTMNERNYKDINIINASSTGEIYENESSPFITLKNLILKNLDKIIIGHLNINSIRHKIYLLQHMTEDNIDILVISETKIDNSFPENQFSMDLYNLAYRLERTQDGGGLLVYFRTGIPSRKLITDLPENVEGILFDMNIRNKKWLIIAGYNPNKEHIGSFLCNVGKSLDYLIGKYENLIIIGDFNSQMEEYAMKDFCETYLLQKRAKSITNRSYCDK